MSSNLKYCMFLEHHILFFREEHHIPNTPYYIITFKKQAVDIHQVTAWCSWGICSNQI
jgi:hypothetical protein